VTLSIYTEPEHAGKAVSREAAIAKGDGGHDKSVDDCSL
jgi:hypothetical protein